MAQITDVGGTRPLVIARVSPDAVGRVTGPVVVVQRIFGPNGEPVTTSPEQAGQENGNNGPTTTPNQTGVGQQIVPTSEVELLQQILLELRAQRDSISSVQLDMRAMRQVLAGPFRFLTFTPQSVSITTPLAIPANSSAALVTQLTFPGSISFIAVMTSASTARIVPRFDGTEAPIDVDQLVTFGINEAVSPGGVNVQADPANNRFTTVLNPGAPEGIAFFNSFALEVTNTGSSSINLLDFFVVMRQYVPLALFPELTQLEPQ